MTFRVGQKVQCIRADIDGWLSKGAVYTVSGGGMFGESYFIDLDEVSTHVPHAWCPTRFRPIVERKTDISIFTRMLKPQTTERRLDAVLHDHGFDPPK